MEHEVSDRREFNRKVAARVRSAMERLSYKQKDVLQMAAAKGVTLRQSALSKLMSDKGETISILDIATVAELLGLDLNELLALREPEALTLPQNAPSELSVTGSEFITDPENRRMRGYINEYSTYFFPTKSAESDLLKGTLTFYPSSSSRRTLAKFVFKTGKQDEFGNDIEKRYQGELVLSPAMSACYCILTNEEIGEISFLLFRYFALNYEKLPCSVAMVLTSSAGPNRLPTAHRMLISPKPISDDLIEILKGQLYMNDNDILISEKGMEAFLKDERIPQEFREYFFDDRGGMRFAGQAPSLYYCFNESVIRDCYLSKKTKLLALNMIRQFATNPKRNKVGKADELLAESLEIGDALVE